MYTKNLLKRLTTPIDDFAKLGDTISTDNGPLTFIDNNANILAVGHLDFVLWNDKPKITRQWGNVKIENTPQLDDRLGVWMILDVLKDANINADILLTDEEESGRSTAQYFKSAKEYNYIVEFDRAGSDVVMYDYEDDDCSQILESVDYSVGSGSFTDICYLSHLGVKGFNFGVGYHNQHTSGCYANLSETFDSFRKFQDFHSQWSGWRFEHTPTWEDQGREWDWNWKPTNATTMADKLESLSNCRDLEEIGNQLSSIPKDDEATDESIWNAYASAGSVAEFWDQINFLEGLRDSWGT